MKDNKENKATNHNNNENEQPVKIDSINLEEKQNNNNKSEIEYNSINKNTNNSNLTRNNNRLSLYIQNSEESIDKDLRNPEEKFQVPENLKKTFLCSLVLFIIGATLIGIGFIQDVAAADPGKGITFWTLGGIVMIPGGYYSYQFYKARKTRDVQERDDILNDIPEL